MNLHIIETPKFKVDGGAFFGVIPKTIWEKQYPADENNMCETSCRSLLIEDGDRIYLIDTGIGNKLDDNMCNSYYVDKSEDIEKNLLKAGYKTKDITDVILTHLHFDHCGGTTKINPDTKKLELTFPNAIHYISTAQWNNANNSNYREKSSFLKENFELLANSNNLKLINEDIKISENIELRIFNGHTPGLVLPVIYTKENTVFFAGDLIPAKASIPLAWISAYDVYPLTSIDEKIKILNEAEANNWILMFQHDYYTECCSLQRTPRGIRVKDSFKFKDIFRL